MKKSTTGQLLMLNSVLPQKTASVIKNEIISTYFIYMTDSGIGIKKIITFIIINYKNYSNRINFMTSGIVKLDYLNEMSGGDKSLILEMIQIFNSEVPGYVKLMEELLKENNLEALGKLAHKAKASALIMGMKNVAEDLKELERLTNKETNLKLIQAYVKTISGQFMSATEELKMIAKTL